MIENKNNIAIVVPIHKTLTKEFINSLKSVAKNYSVIIVDDSDGQVKLPDEWDVYGYKRQQEEMGLDLYNQFILFHKSSACRNFGHWLAYKKGFEYIIGLDSDCNVPPNFVSEHLKSLESVAYGWVNPIRKSGWFPRGFPYFQRKGEIVLNMGLWENELDVNGIDRVNNGKPPKELKIDGQEIAHGILPLCGMNFACRYDAIPALLFLPNFDDGDDKFRRYDDIWGGYIFQKLMQKRNEYITYGYPIVYHDTIVDAEADATLEKSGLEWEEIFYTLIDKICSKVQYGSYEMMFNEFTEIASKELKETPFENLIPSLELWVNLFKQ